jgi:hypothetical protein
MHNSVLEREMQRVVLNRRNSLFAGNPGGCRTASILPSLTGSCRSRDLGAQIYFTQLSTDQSQIRKSQLSNLPPRSVEAVSIGTPAFVSTCPSHGHSTKVLQPAIRFQAENLLCS